MPLLSRQPLDSREQRSFDQPRGRDDWKFSRLIVHGVSWIVATIISLTSCSQKDENRSLSEIKCYPAEILLTGSEALQGVVVQATYSNGITRDITYEARCRLADTRFARFDGTNVVARANGRTAFLVTYAGQTIQVPVTITNAAIDPSISFKLDVMPVFMKAGCNQGSCHGSSKGKDGFHLSLFGFDPDGDYYRLTREQIGRRINLAIPEESLVVQKGLGVVQHTGGVRFPTNSQLYRTLLAWLSAGATNDPASIPKVTGIEIFPKTAVLEGSNAIQRFMIRGSYSDGSQRDLTSLGVFLSNNDATAKVVGDGLVVGGQRGEAFIQARFAEFNVGAQVIVIPKKLVYQWPNVTAHNYIDEAVYTKLKKLRLTPSQVCDDTTFLRRVFLDIAGMLPSAEEANKFLQDATPDKRNRLVNQLLERKEFADLWVMKFAELLQIRSRDNVVYPKAALLYFEWLRDQMLTNVPLDKIVHQLLTASGSNLKSPSANYYQIEPDPLKVAENTAQIFMGMRIQCAQCHNHPFDRWTMNDYYSFAAFFAQVTRKPGDDPRETIVFDRPGGEVKHLVTGAAMRPKFLGGDVPEIKNETRREVLARWLTSPDNPYFARNLANLIWTHFLGRGIIEPVDDVRISNPASNPELLDALTAKLISYKYDFKQLVRDICFSRSYQLSTRPNETNAQDERNFSKAAIRRLRAEVLLDCVSQVTETPNKFPGLPRGARAVQIADGNTGNYFLTTFGRATRTTVCSCEVKTDPNLSQALHLLNGVTVEKKISEGGVVKSLLKEKRTPDQIIESLYLRCFSRKPTGEESAKLGAFLKNSTEPQPILEDLFWSLLNSKEFVFNH
jgi:hypothetical protein